MIRKTIKLIHEGRYVAEVLVELVEDDTGWSPYLSLDDAKKLDAVRLALRRGAIAESAKHGRVLELTPISALIAEGAITYPEGGRARGYWPTPTPVNYRLTRILHPRAAF